MKKEKQLLGGFEFEFASPTRQETAERLQKRLKTPVFVSHEHSSSDGSRWEVKYDSSCSSGRGESDVGGEITSPALSFPDASIVALVDVVSVAQSIGVIVDERCGFHVHVSGLSERVVGRLAGIWCWAEQCFVESVPKRRRANPFCQLVSRTSAFLACGPEKFAEQVELDLLFPSRSTLSPIVKGAKYAFSAYGYSTRGTVEFRLMEGTLDKRDLIMWTRTVAALIVAAETDVDLPDRSSSSRLILLGGVQEVIEFVSKKGEDDEAAEWLAERIEKNSRETLSAEIAREARARSRDVFSRLRALGSRALLAGCLGRRKRIQSRLTCGY